MRDYYSEEIESSKPQARDYFTEELVKNKPEKAESILQKVASFIKPQSADSSPLMNGIRTASSAMTSSIPGLSSDTRQAQEMRRKGIDGITKDPIQGLALDVVTDPFNFAPAESVVNTGIKFGKSVANPSKQFGKSISALEKANPNTRVDVYHIINNALDDPMAKKVIEKSGIIEKFGGSTMEEGGAVTEKLSNLTLKESQDMINTLKSSVRQAVKEGVVKPTEIGIAKMFSDLSKSQNSLFKGFKNAKKMYGVSKNVGKGIKNYGKKVGTGAALAVGGKVGYDIYNSFTGN